MEEHDTDTPMPLHADKHHHGNSKNNDDNNNNNSNNNNAAAKLMRRFSLTTTGAKVAGEGGATTNYKTAAEEPRVREEVRSSVSRLLLREESSTCDEHEKDPYGCSCPTEQRARLRFGGLNDIL